MSARKKGKSAEVLICNYCDKPITGIPATVHAESDLPYHVDCVHHHGEGDDLEDRRAECPEPAAIADVIEELAAADLNDLSASAQKIADDLETAGISETEADFNANVIAAHDCAVGLLASLKAARKTTEGEALEAVRDAIAVVRTLVSELADVRPSGSKG